MRKIATTLCFSFLLFGFSNFVSGQTIIYTDNFSGEDNKGNIGGTIDLSDVDWTIDTSNGSFTASSDYFAVQSGVFEAQDVDGDVIWTSETINISDFDNLKFSFDAGASGDFEASGDIFNVEVVIDGGTAQTLFSGVVDEDAPNDPMFFGSTQLTDELQSFSANISGVGSSVYIRITVNNNAGTELYKFDNLEIKGIPTTNDPILSINTTSIIGLHYFEDSGPSLSQSFEISGANFDGSQGDVNVSAPINFEISESENSNYQNSLSLASFNGSETTIWVRLQQGLTDGDYSGVINVSGGGADSIFVSVSGSVTGPKSTNLPYEQDFSSGFGDIYTFSVMGDDDVWEIQDGNAYMSGYLSGSDQEDWMILPAIDADGVTNPVMTFRTQFGYGSSDENNYLKLYYSTDYSGVDNPTSATWTELSFNRPANEFEWAESGAVDLSSISGSSFYLAFKYLDDDNGNDFRNWEIDDISIEDQANPQLSVDPTELSELTYGEGNGPSGATSFTVEGVSLDGTNVEITAPSNFEISGSESGPYGGSVTLNSFNGNATTVWVRLQAGLAQDTYLGTITISGGGATTESVEVSGAVTYPWDVVETFENFPETESSYGSGNFEGEAGNTWVYVNARGDQQISGPTVGLQNNSEAILSTSLKNGIAEFSFDYLQMFSTNANLQVLINGDSVTTVTSSDERGMVKNSGLIEVEYYGDFEIEFQQGSGGGQVAIDNFSWVNREGQTAQVGMVSLLSPADGAENIGLTPEFNWMTADFADTYTFQLSTNSDLSSPIIDQETDTTAFTPSADLNKGTTYYWRVRGGTTEDSGDWSTIRSFTTIPEAPGITTLTSPADEATEISVTPTLQWEAAAGAASYAIEVSEQSDFSNNFIDTTASSTSFIVGNPLTTGTTFYWRVRAVNAGGESDWSAGRSFTTVVVEPDLPEAVTLTMPADESTGLTLTPEFSWEEETFAENYNFQLATDANFSSIVIDSVGIAGTSFSLSDDLDHLTEYFWRVRGQNSDGTGAWSATRNFTTIIEAPVQVVLGSPADEATNISITPSFSWTEAERAAEYTIQLSASNDFSTNLIDSTITGLSLEADAELEHDSTYYWRVQASNAGGLADWSENWSFTTIVDVPAVVSLGSPENESGGVSTSPILSWNETEGATEYTVQLSAASDFEELIINENTTEATFELSEELDNLAQYYWRVQAVNAGGQSRWSATWSFTTIIAIPEVATLLSPENESTISNDNPPVLTWARAERASEYQLQFAEDEAFEELMVDTTLTISENGTEESDTTYAVQEELFGYETYFWRVKSINEGGEAEWSSAYNFTIFGGLSTEQEGLPKEFTLNQNYPNPFNPTTNLRFGIPEASEVRLEVYNMLGQRVRTLVNERKSAGWHTVVFDASSLSSGMYIYRIKADNFLQTKQMMLIK